MLRVPEAITQEIQRFASNVSGGRPPVIVPVIPDWGAANLSCGQNVQSVCEERAGRAIKGWRIWWIPQILIEAQAHVVWQSPSGQLLDVTPNQDREQTCVFAFDETMIENPGFDFVPSRHENLCGEAIVDEYIRCAAVVARHIDKCYMADEDFSEPPESATLRQALVQIAKLPQMESR